MKRSITMFLLLCCAICANAQWVRTEIAGDELKGRQGFAVRGYDVPSVGAISFREDQTQFMLTCSKSFFNYKYSGAFRGVNVLVGLYDQDNKLIEKWEMWLDVRDDDPKVAATRNLGTMNNPVGQNKKLKKLFHHIIREKGFVRMVAPLYGEADFDLKVPCLSE